MFSLPKNRKAALTLSALTLLSVGVYAGTASYGVAKRSEATAADAQPGFGITGDWGGVRSSLLESGFSINGSYTGEWFGNLKGGKTRAGVLEGLFKLGIDVNLEKAFGWQGATFRVSTLAPHGTSPSKFVGDVSALSNIDAYDSVRLVDFWIEQRLLEDQLSVKVGQMRVDDEFGVSNTASFFINSSFGVPDAAYTRFPIASYPISALGVRAKFEPVKGLYGMAGIYDGNPSPGDLDDPTTRSRGSAGRHGTDWALHRSEGALYAFELGYEHSLFELPGAIRLGWLHHTDGFRRNSGHVDGSNNSTYFVIDQTLWQKPGSSKEGLSGFIKGISAQTKRNPMDRSLQTGLAYTGVLGSEDKIGVAYARNRISSERGIPNGDHESILEVSYQFPIMPSVKIQPDFQYISHPGGSKALPNAWVIGVRATVDF